MSGFLDNYELANDTIIRFRKEHPTGRIVTEPIEYDFAAGWVVFKALIYREYEDQLPSAVSTANGNVAFYPANMKKWYVEDTETSAIARAIKLLSPTTSRPSREDMARVEYEPTPSEDLWATLTVSQTELETGTKHVGNVIAMVKDKLDASPVPQQNPHCKHGEMLYKTGTSAKTGNPYTGYTCTSKNREDQCKPVWL
jgi:hypothetical protein